MDGGKLGSIKEYGNGLAEAPPLNRRREVAIDEPVPSLTRRVPLGGNCAMSKRTRGLGLFCFGTLSLLFVATARADTVVLKGGGQISGEILGEDHPSPETKPQDWIRIRTRDGVLLEIPRTQVAEVVRLSAVQAEYERLREKTPDTVEGHFGLADWCRDHHLPQQRELHLRRIIELEPDNARARALLGYQKVGNEWKTRDEIMKSMGYVLYKGRWMLPQQVQLEQEKEEQTAVHREWAQKIHRLLNRFEADPVGVEHELRSIKDPAAVKPLVLAMKDERRDVVRLTLADVLGGIGSPEAIRALAIIAIEDPVEEVRLRALEFLAPTRSGEVVAYFVGRLQDKDNTIVNRAGEALKRMGDPSAIPALIDALVTRHKFVIPGRRPPGAIGAGFSSSSTGQSGMSFGAGGGGDSTKIVERAIPNRAVLEALVELSGGKNFGFDVRLWKQWYAEQKRMEAAKALQ